MKLGVNLIQIINKDLIASHFQVRSVYTFNQSSNIKYKDGNME